MVALSEIPYRIHEQFTVFGGINNPTDETPDVAELSYPLSAVGRRYFLGLRYRM
jgi:outer membrane receptor protein involved in Fe transport